VNDIAAQILAEIDRARRLLQALNDPQDRMKIERYIAELDGRISNGAQPEAA
jgi:hypothetical protein